MSSADDTQEQEFEILEALAKISARDFRLGQFMADIGLDPNQPVLFYRQLIREAHENNAFTDTILRDLFGKEEIVAKLTAAVKAKDEQLRTLTTKLHTLQNGTHQKTESLEKERKDLLAAASELQDKVWKYDALIQLLKGEIEPATLKALSNLFGDAYMDTLSGKIEGRPPPDPARLDEIRQKLRQDLVDILRIPKQELEQKIDALQTENKKLRGQIDAIVDMLRNLYKGGGIEGAG